MQENLDLVSMLQERMPPFAKLIGIKFLSASPERLTAEMPIRDDLCTTKTTVHGGALMAFADTLGACATVINLKEGYARIEDKLLCTRGCGNQGHRRERGFAPRQKNYGVADKDHKRRWTTDCGGHANADGARA